MLGDAVWSKDDPRMANRDLPVSSVEAFVEKAKNVGTYGAPVAANLQQALKLVLDQAKKTNPKADQVKVGALLDMVDTLLDEYGGQTKASIGSITAYKWRSKRLLQDFIDHNDGDFMAWKVAQAKKSKSSSVKSAKKPKAADQKSADKLPDAPADEGGGKTGQALVVPQDFIAHTFPLRRDLTVTIPLPVSLTKKDVARLKSWMDSLVIDDDESATTLTIKEQIR